jgi:hypothetical protein
MMVVVMVSTRTLLITTTPRARTVAGALFMLIMALDAILVTDALELLAMSFLSIARTFKFVIARLGPTIARRGLSAQI